MKRLVPAAMVTAGLAATLSAAHPLSASQNDASVRGGRAVAQPIVKAMAEAAGASVDATYSRRNGRVVFLSVRGRRGVPSPDPSAHSDAERARSFLRSFGPAFGLGPESEVLVTRDPKTDTVGLDHVRVQQTFRGIPVVAAELMLHFRGTELVAANGKALPDLAVDTTPTVDAEHARQAVRKLARERLGAETVDLSEPELQILDVGLFGGPPWPTQLAWFVVARSERLREYVWVDAHRGGVALHFNQNPEALNRTVYDAGYGTVLPGTLVRSEGQADVGDADVDNAYRYAGDTYYYYLTQHGRDSYDGAGAEVRSSVRYSRILNAFWDGSQMVYGPGYPAADDVVGHELTHAVTEHEANLFYYMQSGAISESLSDIFGETIDFTNGAGTDTPAVRWLIGEDLPGGGTGIRNMMDPTAFGAYPHGDPGKVTDAGFSCGGATGNADAGGVHANSGVPNHAYALTVDGGAYNGRTITGIGLTKAAKIEYRTLTTYLLSGSDFVDYDLAVRQSCRDLVETDGITDADCLEVDRALDAVEISQPWPCDPIPPEVLALCPGGQTPTDVWFDDFEGVTSGRWSTTLLSGTPNHWNVPVEGWRAGTGDSSLYFSDFAESGTHHLWGYDHFSVADSAVEMTAGVPLPVNARLQFSHSFGFDNESGISYDVGVIEYCTDTCASWQDAGALIGAGAAYNGSAAEAMYGNPLAGRLAFTGASRGYTATQLDLGALAGHTFRLRFRIGSDSDYDDYGWFIDDVHIYECPSPTPGTVTDFHPDNGPVGTKVAIEGLGFTGATAVEFHGAPAAFAVNSATSITATVPHGATSGPIRVITPQGTGASATPFRVVVPRPTITRFAPLKGPVGTEVTITGANFTGATAVTFTSTSRVNATFTVVSASSITATVPAAGPYPSINVTTPGGTAFSVAPFEVTTTCTTSVSPTRARVDRRGGSGAIVVAAPAGCAWSVTSEGGWLHTAVTSGSGTATIPYTVDLNPGASREGGLWVDLRPFPVDQEGWLTDIHAGLMGVAGGSAWGDYDNDGDPDLLLAGTGPTAIVSVVYRNDGGGTFTDIGAGLQPVRGSAAWGDFDNDSDLDILLAGFSPGYGYVAKVYRNDDGVFTDVGADLARASHSAAWGDYDGDGDLDILLVDYSATKVYRNEGGGVFTDTTTALPGVFVGGAAWGDYDKDGDLDIVLIGHDAAFAQPKVYRNDGQVFTDIGAPLEPVANSAVAWGDCDGDGLLDIVLAGVNASSKKIIWVYRNQGGAAFTDIGAALAGSADPSIALGDYDGDGDLDILVGGSQEGTVLYRNDRAGRFTDAKVALPPAQNGSVAWSDYDGDGDLDLVLTGYGNPLPFASVYRNDRGIQTAGFHTVTPCRALDSRDPAGPFAGRPVAAGEERLATIGGRCGVPATAVAVAVNLTAVGATTMGHLRMFPAGTERPTSSTLNFRAGTARANNAITMLGAQGAVALFSGQASGTVHVVIDVAGYFE